MSDSRINTLLPPTTQATNTPAAPEPLENPSIPEKEGCAKMLGEFKLIDDYMNSPKPGMK